MNPSVTRRRFLYGSAAAGAVVVASCSGRAIRGEAVGTPLPRPATQEEALRRLMDGNQRFRTGRPDHPGQSEARRAEVAMGQEPWAVVLGCIDSRVPPEIVFDQGLGELFVTRTAGQVLDDAALGSVEFGAAEFETPLVVVRGHQRCGAVGAAIEALEAGSTPPGSIGTIVEGIAPAVEEAEREGGDLTDRAVRANVRNGVEALRSSPVLSRPVGSGDLRIIGAYYSLDTGSVSVIVP